MLNFWLLTPISSVAACGSAIRSRIWIQRENLTRIHEDPDSKHLSEATQKLYLVQHPHHHHYIKLKSGFQIRNNKVKLDTYFSCHYVAEKTGEPPGSGVSGLQGGEGGIRHRPGALPAWLQSRLG